MATAKNPALVADRLWRFGIKRGMRASTLAAYLGTTRAVLNQLALAELPESPGALDALCRAYGIPTERLAEITGA